MVGVEAERRGGGLTPAKLESPLQVTKILIASFLILGGLLSVTPSVQAQACTTTETFGDDQTFFAPTSCWYSYSLSGTTAGQTYVIASPANSTPNSLQTQVGFTASPQFPVISLNDPLACATNSVFEFQFQVSSLPTTTVQIFLLQGSSSNVASIRLSALGAVTGRLHSSTASTFDSSVIPGLTIAPSTWYRVQFTGFDCTDGQEKYTLLFPDQATGACVCPSAGISGIVYPIDTWQLSGVSNALWNSGYVWVDDFALTGLTIPTPGSIFCANPAETDFGYEYVEGASYESSFSQVGIGIDDGFLFTGDSSNSEYLAKGFTTGTEALSVKMKLEAASDGASSIFRAAFTTGATAPPSVTNKGDGKDGGNFDDHVGVRFEEDGGAWIIGIYQNVGGAGYNRIGSAVNYGDPDNPTNFNFTVDTRTLVANLSSEGNLLLTRTIDSSFQDVPMKDQWFVGTGGTFAVDANTILDDADQSDNDDSTCIFDLIGGAVATGSGGLSPGSSIPDAPTPTTPEGFDDLAENFGNVFGGIGATGGAVFLGIFWILVFAAGAYGILGGSPLAIGIGALCGFVFSIFTGLIPDILVFVVVLLAGAAVGMRLFGGGGSGADG